MPPLVAVVVVAPGVGGVSVPTRRAPEPGAAAPRACRARPRARGPSPPVPPAVPRRVCVGGGGASVVLLGRSGPSCPWARGGRDPCRVDSAPAPPSERSGGGGRAQGRGPPARGGARAQGCGAGIPVGPRRARDLAPLGRTGPVTLGPEGGASSPERAATPRRSISSLKSGLQRVKNNLRRFGLSQTAPTVPVPLACLPSRPLPRRVSPPAVMDSPVPQGGGAESGRWAQGRRSFPWLDVTYLFFFFPTHTPPP